MSTTLPALVEYDLNDDVRLLDRHGDVPSGSIGRVLGKIPGSSGRPTYVVSFVDKKVCVLSVRFNEILLADLGAYA